MSFSAHIAATRTRLERALGEIPGRVRRFVSGGLHKDPSAKRCSPVSALGAVALPEDRHGGRRRWEGRYQPRLCRLILAAIACCLPFGLLAQQPSVAMNSDQGLPDAPGVVGSSGASADGSTAQKGSATIYGTVMDANGSEVQGARVVLRSLTGAGMQVQHSGSNGAFTFHGLPAGNFKLTVTGSGWGTYVSPIIELHTGDYRIVPQIMLPVGATSTDVTVVGDREELAEEQVHIAEQQRVLRVFPNFYSSYDWNAPPMGAKQKFQLSFRSLIDPVTFIGAGTVAGVEQVSNTFPGYGTGVQGYAKRYGAAYADDVTARMLGKAIFPSIFHQDPRYFYRGSGSIRSRAFYALSAALIARSDNGHWGPNYSQVLGSFASGGLSNLYYPAASRGLSLTLANGAIDIADYAGTNLLREFVLRRFTTHGSDEAN